jgi:membrane-associated protease RseP (regulator of RpoE activity)
MRPFTPPPKDFFTNGWRFTGAPPPARPSYHIHLLLFVMTVVTTVVAGMVIEGVHPLQSLSQFYRGLPYAGTLLVILFSHEMGHYLTARHYGMDVTLPYFLPAPPPWFFVGTLGAFIRMKSPAQHRQALLYIAAAGPIAGFCAAIPAVLYAYATSTVAPVDPAAGGLYFGEPLLLQAVGYFMIGPIPDGFALHINSVGVAAWFGLVVTMFNLMPMGQLDGGHIIYALFGVQARHISRIVVGVLLVMGFFFPGWFLWAALGWLTTLRQPTIIDQHRPLDRNSRLIAGLSLVIFVLCFMPVPISLGPFSE